MASLLIAFGYLVILTDALPTINFPINSQLPPVARIGQQFSYSFSPYTFSSDDNSKLTYTLGSHPSWLSIDSESRLLLGTPEDGGVPSGEVVGQRVEIIATDATGSTTLNSTLVVTRRTEPTVQTPLSEQIPKFGKYSAPSSILLYPSTAFKLPFSPNTFSHGPDNSYYAVSQNMSPLPAWIKFDAKSLTFSGQTPAVESLVQPPQTFNFELVASDIVGFSGVSIPFSIVVGSHKLTTDQPTIDLNTTRGTKIDFDGLGDGIKLDGKMVKPGSLQATTHNLPSWLSFDKNSWNIEGTPANDDHSSNFTVNFHDQFADDLTVLVAVNIATGLFQSTFHDIEVEAGEDLNLDLSTYFRNPSDVNVDIKTDPVEDWLKINGFVLSGKIPDDVRGSLRITVAASSKSSDMKDTEKMKVTFLDPRVAATATSTTDSPESTSTSGPTSTHTNTHNHHDEDSDHTGGIGTSYILLATLIPILFIALMVMLLVCFCRRRRQKQTYINSNYRSKISKPIVSSLRVLDSEATLGNDKFRHAFQPDGVFLKGKNPVVEEIISVPSSSSESSRPSLGAESMPEVGRAYMAGGAGPPDLNPFVIGMSSIPQSRSDPGSVSGRQSWVTVEDATLNQRSSRSKSQHSDTTYPDSAHILLPTPSFFEEGRTFRDGLNIPLAGFAEGVSSIQPTPELAYVPRKSPMRPMSSATSSSEALPSSRAGSQRTRRLAPLGEGHSTIPEDGPTPPSPLQTTKDTMKETSQAYPLAAPEPPIPNSARLSMSRRGLPFSATPDNGNKTTTPFSLSRQSFVSDTSFGSGENWRIIGERSPVRKPPRPVGRGGIGAEAEKSYSELVEEVEWHPSRPGTAGGDSNSIGNGDTGKEEWKTLGKLAVSASGGSKLSAASLGGSQGSFKVFL